MQKPKFSIGSWAFSFGPVEDNPWSFEKFITYAANAGYNGVEINGFEPHPHPDTYHTAKVFGIKAFDHRSWIGDFGLRTRF